jgi:hypothetical protein
LKISTLTLLALAFMASTAFAGGSSCSASKEVKSASSESACISTVFAGAGNSCSASKAKLAELVDIEATRLPSGGLVVMYRGKTDDAVAYLQAATAGSAENFCCPVTRKLASTEGASVEITKISDGALVVVNAKKASLVDEYEESFLTLAAAATK